MTTPHPLEPKRTAYNRKLLQQLLVKEKYFSQYPRVSEQVECLPLDTTKLFPNGYNPTINAQGEMVYRFHRGGLASTKLARAILGKDGSVFSNHELQISGGIIGNDDPKIFSFRGDQYLSWVESDWEQTGIPTACCVKYAKFSDGKLTDFKWPKKLPRNDGTQWCKNLVFFEHNDQLLVIYQCHPSHLIFSPNDDNLMHLSDPPLWPYGDIRGGTPPLPYEGKLLRFFHSRINHDLGAVPWRYFMGAMLINPEPPFKVVQVSKKPIVFGSEVGAVKKKDCYHFKEKIVFPGGAIETTGGHLVALGVNDCEIALAKITPSMLGF